MGPSYTGDVCYLARALNIHTMEVHELDGGAWSHMWQVLGTHELGWVELHDRPVHRSPPEPQDGRQWQSV